MFRVYLRGGRWRRASRYFTVPLIKYAAPSRIRLFKIGAVWPG